MLSALEGRVTNLKKSMGGMKKILKEHIEELNGELVIYKAALGNRVLVAVPNPKVDVLKPNEFKGTRFCKGCRQLLMKNRAILLCQKHHR
ncbi:hypothetical protein PVK06_002532 [Gossypium arboreum]|uniref:Uncharacterized protein n=1 Tax=Gossypium arboreum TaxID=29729 RepID=A0ABR0R3T8_GOSAR|nr:hypothetical protein PVK06_002532 [Gossypium arboreum]